MEQVLTKLGYVRGAKENGMWAYRGIPFAASAAGAGRFRPPVPARPWSGVLDATKDGTRPWQKPAPWATDADTHIYGEDCLNLNVWTPAPDGAKRPVIVLIFGGGHFEGSNCELGASPQKLFDGGEYVMVAPNYRVGALGYLYLPHLLGDEYAASGNLGLLDQIMALRWVRDNIECFGGDPHCVTIMGQSAGGKSVASLLATPMASGLYHRAVMMSGGLQCIKDIHTETELTRNFLNAAGLTEANAAELLAMPLERLRDAQEKANESYFKAESYGATADGVTIPTDMEGELIGASRLKGLPVLMGHTRQELYLRDGADKRPLAQDEMLRRLRWKFGRNAPHVMRAYQRALARDGFEAAYGGVMTEYTYRQACLRTARILARAGANVYLYRWDDPGGTVAYHTSDLETLLGMPRKLADERANQRAAELIRHSWLRFACDGSPQTNELPSWQPCGADDLRQMSLCAECHVLESQQRCIDEEFPLQVMRL